MYRVLLADDHPMFRQGLKALLEREGFEVVAEASDGHEAVRLARKHELNIAILDIGMPMLDGLQLLGIIKRRHPAIKIAVMTGNVTEAKRADALAGGAEVFLEKPVTAEGMKLAFNVLNDLVSWHSEGFTGALRQVGLPEVIQMECNSRHSLILEILNPEVHGQIYIEAGAITHAAAGDFSGEPAFNRLLSLRGGGFEMKPFQAPPQRTINRPWEQLLMEAARSVDEETVLTDKPAARPEDVPAAPPQPAEAPTDHGLGDEIVVVATYDGTWNKKDESTRPDGGFAGDDPKK